MTVVNAWTGAVTSNSARVVAKIDGTNAELFIADNPDMTGAVSFGSVAADADDIADLAADGLDSGTEYWWQIEVDSVADESTTGRFRTHTSPGVASSFRFWVSGDAGLNPDTPGTGDVLAGSRLSDHAVFTTIHDRALDESWLFGVHLGDLHYYDLGSGDHSIMGGASEDNYRRGYDDVLLQDNQHELYRDVPLVYLWDDHDYGPNDSDRTHAGRANAQTVYRQRVPHYPLADADGIWHSFQVGRVLFVASDVRSLRDPNNTPQSSSKTLLGEAQKQWLSDLLGDDTSAEVLVWLCPERAWHVPQVSSGSSADHWGNFPAERDELTQLFQQTGWAERMVYLGADAHQMGIDSGASNQHGGWPVAQFAALDCSTAGLTPAGIWDVGSATNRAQYGTVDVADQGDRIDITLTGWADSTELMSHTFSVVLMEPEEPAPDIPPLPTGITKPTVEWQSFDLVSGRLIADLPDITGSLERILGEHTSTSLDLPIPLSGPGSLGEVAFQATTPGRTMLVAVVNDQPAWGGMVIGRNGGTSGTIKLSCVTLEGYLARRRVRDHNFVQVDEATIAAALAADAGTILGVGSGIGLEIDAPPTGTLRDREYKATDRATVYKRLQELSDVQGGPEWTIELLWGDDTHTWVRKVLRVRKRIGVASTAPAAVFETTASSVFESRGGNEARYDYDEDFSDGRGANYIIAYSSGEGDDQPASTPALDTAALDAGFPIYERQWQPSSSIRDVAVLDQHAQRELQLRRNGARTWNIEARWNVYPRLNIDWRIGDDVAWKLIGHRHPNGVTGHGRCIGWELNPEDGIVTPVLLDPTSDGSG